MSYPANLDNLTNPGPTDYEDVVSHSAQHSNANDAIEAIEAKVGADSSAVSSSVDYKLTQVIAELAGTQSGVNLLSPLFKGLIDGWVNPNDTWTYASASTITIPAGGLLKYSVGDKLKLNQSIPLTSYWTFDGQSLIDNKDSHNGTDVGTGGNAVTYSAAKFSYGAVLPGGSAGGITVADHADFHPTSAFTFGMWIKTSTTDKMIFQSYFNLQGAR